MEILPSAWKHGIHKNDILHAIRNAYLTYETDDDEVIILIGPAHDTTPLEIGVLLRNNESKIIHAMKARKKYLDP